MPCILTAHVTGSLEAVTVNLLYSDLKVLYVHPNYYVYQELEAETSGSLEASINHIFEASTSGSLQASTKFRLDAKYCWQATPAI